MEITVPKKADVDQEFELPSGKKVVMRSFKGRDVREAQNLAGGESGKLLFAIISLVCTIDGSPVTCEELDEVDGMDALTLMGKFGSNFSSAPNK